MKGLADLEQLLQHQGIEAEIVQAPAAVRTVEQAAAAMGVPPDRIVKSLLFIAAGRPTLVITLGPDRIDKSQLAQKLGLLSNQIELASPDQVLALTGYAVGTVPPLGLGADFETLVDERVMGQLEIIAGGGSNDTLLRITPEILLQHCGGRLIRLEPAG